MSSEGASPGELFVISAPSGAGKTTLIRGMMDQLAGTGEPRFSISHTSRRPRLGEIEGREYHFVSADRFRDMIAAGLFLEWAEVHGHLYGTSREAVVPFLEGGEDMVLDLDVQGAEQLLRGFPAAHSVFILPPSYRDLERRLRGRGLDRPEEIERRLGIALQEISCYISYQYVIVNDDVERASRALAAIVLEKRHRRSRVERRVAEVVADFERARANLSRS